MSRYDAMFLRELEELEKDKSGDGWAILRTAAPLRKLLFDQGQTFIALTNRAHHLKLQFEVGEGYFRGLVARIGPEIGLSDEAIANTFWNAEAGLLPENMDQSRRYILTLPQFLKHIVLQIGSWDYSIQDVIEFAAYYHGVVHPKEPDASDHKNLALLEWSGRAAFPLGGLPREVNLLRHISTIVLRSLQPLRAAVELQMQTETTHRPPGPA